MDKVIILEEEEYLTIQKSDKFQEGYFFVFKNGKPELRKFNIKT